MMDLNSDEVLFLRQWRRHKPGTKAKYGPGQPLTAPMVKILRKRGLVAVAEPMETATMRPMETTHEPVKRKRGRPPKVRPNV